MQKKGKLYYSKDNMQKQFLITKNSLRKYLLSNSFSVPIEEVEDIKEVTQHTGSSYIFKARTKIQGEIHGLIVKQTLGHLKIDPHFKLSKKRLVWEINAIRHLQSIIGQSYLPRIYWFDSANNILVMSDIRGEKGTLLREELDKDNPHEEIMPAFGNLLADIHLDSYGKNKTITIRNASIFSKEWKNFILNEVVNNFYTVGARKASIPSIVDDLLDESRKAKQAIIWMDSIAKNILINDGNIKLVDFETIVKWDIAWDAAIFISDWIIKCAEVGENSENKYRLAAEIFLETYLKRMHKTIKGEEFDGLKRRIYRYIGVFLLHRTSGANPYTFDQKMFTRIQNEGLRLLQGLYANDFAKFLVNLLGINRSFIQKETIFKSLGFNVRGILQIPRLKTGRKIPIAILFHGGTDKGMVGSPAIFETSQKLLKAGIAVYRINFVGTDTSDGLLCQKDWDVFEDNFVSTIRFIRRLKQFSTIGVVGRSFSATVIAANAKSSGINAFVLQNPIFDVWYEFINLLPDVTKEYIDNPKNTYIPLGDKGKKYIQNDKQYIKGDYKFSSKIVTQFPREKWKIMQQIPQVKNVCIIQAENDQETAPPYAEILYNKTQSPKALHIIKGTVHRFPGKEKEVAKITSDWLIKHLIL